MISQPLLTRSFQGKNALRACGIGGDTFYGTLCSLHFAIVKEQFLTHCPYRFFRQTKYPSFQRQLNLYGFSRFAHGKDKGAYFHQCFVRGDRPLVRGMVRRKIKGTKVRRAISPHEEPDFYAEAYTMATDKLKIPPVYSCSIASTEESETPSVVSSGEEQSFTSDLDTVSLDDDDFILFDPLTLFRSESLANDIALGAIAI